MKDLEHQHQKALVAWAGYAAAADPRLRLLYAVPNGANRGPAAAGKSKAEGQKRGVPDLCLPVPVMDLHGLYLELKVGAGRLSPEQRVWLKELADLRYGAVVAYGWEAAKDAITDYLRGQLDRPADGISIYKRAA
jgi:hypothetical protein